MVINKKVMVDIRENKKRQALYLFGNDAADTLLSS